MDCMSCRLRFTEASDKMALCAKRDKNGVFEDRPDRMERTLRVPLSRLVRSVDRDAFVCGVVMRLTEPLTEKGDPSRAEDAGVPNEVSLPKWSGSKE